MAMERFQQQWGEQSPFLPPSPSTMVMHQSPLNSPLRRNSSDIVGLDSALSNLIVSPDYALRRQLHAPMMSSAMAGAADVALGPRSEVYGSGNVELLQGAMRRAQARDLGWEFGGPYQNPIVGPTRSWTHSRNLSSAASGEPWVFYGGGGGDELRFRNSEIAYYEQDPFLLCKKQSPPNVPFLNQLYNSYQNPVESVNSLLPRDLGILNSQSPILSKNVPLNLKELQGKIVSLAKYQNGCRILQDNLGFLDDEGTEVVVSEIIEYVGDLMKNQSGSYLIQKLFSVCSEEQKTNIILAVTKKPFQLISICLNPFGARVMVKLLEDLSSPQQRSLAIAALCPGAVTLASDPNGHLVILYCLKNFSFEYNKHLIREIAKNCFGVATNRNGCCVLQSCIENALGEAKESLVNEIIANAVQLSENPYGNYVVQHLLGQNIPGMEECLLERLEGKFVSLACNKYASNVVEKFFVKPGELSTKVIKELVSSPKFSMLLVHPFGNYVIQRALKVAKGEILEALLDQIRENEPSMKINIYGKMILTCLSKGGRDMHTASSVLLCS